MKEKILHLLIPKLFRVWCLPNREIGAKDFTTKPSECSCANCLTQWRRKTTGRRSVVRVSGLPGRKHWTETMGGQWREPVLPENL